MSDSLVNPSGPWQAGAKEFTMDYSVAGRSNIGWGAVSTADQVLAGSLRMSSFKLDSSNKQNDYYSVFGHMTHGVAHNNPADNPYNPSPNWVSVGYYANLMSLSIELLGTEGLVWEAGPTSTVGSHTTSFSIGAGLSGEVSGEGPSAGANVGVSFGASFSSPNVVIANSVVGHVVKWDVKLPGVGYVSPGVPANPEEPSYAGYKWAFGSIFQVPKNTVLNLRVHPYVHWQFDYTRGITNDNRNWNAEQNYTHQ